MANKITTILDLDDKGFKSTLKGIGTSVGQADGMFGKFKAGAQSAFAGLKQYAAEGALAAGAALVAFSVKAVGAFTDVAKEAIDLSTATGLSIEEASRWVGVADDYVVSAEALTTGLGKIAKTIDDTKWAQYGIATRDASGEARATNDILLDTFDMLSKVDNKTEQAVIGQKLFGKGYQSLTPILGHTRAEYEAMLGAVEKGQVITEQEAAKAEKMRLAQDKLADSIKEVTLAWGQVVAGMSPFIERVADSVTMATSAVEKIDDLADSIGGLGTVIDIATKDPITVFQDLKDAAGDFTSYASMSLPEVTRVIKEMGLSLTEQNKILADWHAKNDEGAASTDEAAVALRAMGEEAHNSQNTVTGYSYALQDVKRSTEEAAAATKEATRMAEFHASALENERDKTKELYSEERSAVDAKYAFAESTRKAGEDVAALTDALKHHKEGTDEVTAATDAAKASVLKASEDYATLKGAALDSDGGIRRQIDSLSLQAAALAPGSPLRLFLEGYITDLKNIPSNISTALNLNISQGQVTTAAGDPIGLRARAGGVAYGAEGGIIKARPGGQLLVAGEGRHDEALIPLDGNQGIGGNIYYVQVDVHGSIMTERDITKAVYNGIIDGQRRGELVAGIT